MINQELLYDTLQKINASLNKRFEKNATLYISKQDESDMKSHFCNGAYTAVVDMVKAKGISPDIAVKVLLRNAGVINVTDLNRFKRELQPVFQSANFGVLEYMMEDVFANNVYMQREVRHILVYYYIRGISAEKRLEYWNSAQFPFDAYEREDLYGQILENGGGNGPLKTLDDKIEFMNRAFVQFPSILSNKNAILKLVNSLEGNEKAQFLQHLNHEMKQPSIDEEVYLYALMTAYCSYGKTAFQDAIGKIKAGNPLQYKKYVSAIQDLFWKEEDPDTLENMFDVLVKAYNTPYMKPHIRRRIAQKVWPVLKRKQKLYQRRKAQIEQLLTGVEDATRKKYTSFADIAQDISAGVSPQKIAYAWLNMPWGMFEGSLEESFSSLKDIEDIKATKEVYDWLFLHSTRRGGAGTLRQLCVYVAATLFHYRLENPEQTSRAFALMDEIWVEYVTKYKLKGKLIENYLFEAHYDQVKDWKN